MSQRPLGVHQHFLRHFLKYLKSGFHGGTLAAEAFWASGLYHHLVDPTSDLRLDFSCAFQPSYVRPGASAIQLYLGKCNGNGSIQLGLCKASKYQYLSLFIYIINTYIYIICHRRDIAMLLLVSFEISLGSARDRLFAFLKVKLHDSVEHGIAMFCCVLME